MYRLQVKRHFDAAHYIRDYDGKCANMHGHRWEVEACLSHVMLLTNNISSDFKVVKEAMDGLIEEYLDHHILNETLNEQNVTAEFLARWFYDNLFDYLPNLVRVTIWESPDCCVKYSPDMVSVGG